MNREDIIQGIIRIMENTSDILYNEAEAAEEILQYLESIGYNSYEALENSRRMPRHALYKRSDPSHSANLPK